MGKSAGNLPIELISMYMNDNCGKCYDISQMLEAIDINIMPVYRQNPWGYNLFYYISASNHCHPSYVQFLMDRHTLSLKALNAILDTIAPEKKLLYDKEHIELLYRDYQSRECRDEAAIAELSAALSGRPLLLLGPGKNMELQKERVLSYIRERSPVILAVNYIPEDIAIDYAFLTNSRRYVQLESRLLDIAAGCDAPVRIIATSNIANVRAPFDYTLNYSALIDPDAEIIDNSFVMLLNVLVRTGVNEAACAGFDGYTVYGDNYFNASMDYQIARQKSDSINQYVSAMLKRLRGVLDLHFLTDTLYQSPDPQGNLLK